MKKILVVEDNPLNRDLLVQLLEDDFEVIEAEDGLVGVEQALACSPDLVLMDMSMPRMDGWEATEKLRSLDNTRHLPIIALTAHAVKGDRERAMNAGCNEYLSKPVDEDKLFALIEKLLG